MGESGYGSRGEVVITAEMGPLLVLFSTTTYNCRGTSEISVYIL